MAKKANKTKKATEEGKFKLYDLAGISHKRAEEILKAVDHAKIDVDTWQKLYPLVVENANLTKPEEFFYLGWSMCHLYQIENNPIRELARMIAQDHKH